MARPAALLWASLEERAGWSVEKLRPPTLTVAVKVGLCGGPSFLVEYSGGFHRFLWHSSWSLVLFISLSYASVYMFGFRNWKWQRRKLKRKFRESIEVEMNVRERWFSSLERETNTCDSRHAFSWLHVESSEPGPGGTVDGLFGQREERGKRCETWRGSRRKLRDMLIIFKI